MSRLPSLFVSHGGPNVVVEPSEARDFLSGLRSLVPAPRAILVMSAHFETEGVAVVTDPAPQTQHDFGGFAAELYRMAYPAPGDPALAARALDLLEAAGLGPVPVPRRGYDHGVWNPLILGFPQADVPVVQVSIDPSRDARWHHRIGRALAPLAEDGVLLLGSGHITHNLRAVIGAMRGMPVPAGLDRAVDAFTGWMADAVAAGDEAALLDWRARAPFVADNHPTDEHLMPFFFALGAGGPGARGERIHASVQYGAFAWDAYRFG